MIDCRACISIARRTPCSMLVIGLLAGCGDATGHDPQVTGTVKLDRSPLESGTVVFQPDDPSVAPQMAQIEAGQFSLRVKPGKYRIKIEASHLVPDKTGKHGEPIYESQIPERYNRKTTLSANVVVEGANQLNFELESD